MSAAAHRLSQGNVTEDTNDDNLYFVTDGVSFREVPPNSGGLLI